MMMDLTDKEKKIIEILRSDKPYIDLRIEKRPTRENPKKSEPARIIIEESVLL